MKLLQTFKSKWHNTGHLTAVTLFSFKCQKALIQLSVQSACSQLTINGNPCALLEISSINRAPIIATQSNRSVWLLSHQVEIEGMVGSKTSKDGSSSHKARVSVATPIEGYRQMVASVGLDGSSSQHQLSTQLVMGSKRNVISSSLVVATPFTPYDIDLTFKADTPYQGYGAIGMTLTHKLDNALNTKVSRRQLTLHNSSKLFMLSLLHFMKFLLDKINHNN